MRYSEIILLIVFFVFFFLIYSVEAAVLTVCSSDCNSTTVQGGIDLASNWDEVMIIDSGEYQENIVVNKSILLTSNSTVKPVIWNNGTVMVVNIAANDSSIKNLEIKYNGTDTEQAVEISEGKNNITISNNTISDLSGDTLGGDAILINQNSTNITVSYNNIKTSAIAQYGFGVDISQFCSDITVIYNKINTSVGYEYGISMYRSWNNNVSFNEINSTGDYGIHIEDSYNNYITYNNITGTGGIYIYDSGIILPDVENNTFSYNNITTIEKSGDYGISASGTITYNKFEFNSISTSGSNQYGIRLSSLTFPENIIISNTIKTSGNGAYGIYVDSAYNQTIVNSTINTTNATAIYLKDCINVTIKDSTINAPNNSDIYLSGFIWYENYIVNSSFNKSNIAFSALTQKIKLYNQYYLDVYVNDTLGNPINQANISVRDKNNILALFQLTNSSGYIQSQFLSEFMANSTPYNATNGYYYFSNYTINATKAGYNSDQKQVNLTESMSIFLTLSPEQNPPTYSNNQTNSNEISSPCNFTLDWNDVALHPLGQYIFSTNNSGTWTNSSAVNFSSTPETAWNVTVLNDTVGTLIQWKFYAMDNNGNWNVSDEYSLTTTDETSPQYSSNSTNSTIAGKLIEFRLRWTDNVGLDSYIFSLDNCASSFSNITESTFQIGGTEDWSNETYVINDTAGCNVRWKVYANDSSNNWNVSDTFSFVTLPSYCDVSILEIPSGGYQASQNNTYYCLGKDFNNVDSGFGSGAVEFVNYVENSTLDCLNYILNGTDANSRHGVYLRYNKNATIKNCNISNFYTGIYDYYSNNTSILNNSAISNTNSGILLEGSSNRYGNVTDNFVDGKGETSYGIRLWDHDYGYIKNNNVTGVVSYGIYARFVDNSTIYNNTVKNSGYEIYLESSHYNNVTNNTAVEIISLYGSSNNKIVNNTVRNIELNPTTTGSNSNTIENNIVKDGTGIYFFGSDNNTLTNNTIFNNTYGIWIYGGGPYFSDNNTITGNTIHNNTNDYILQNPNILTNYFKSTNFTAARTIRFEDSTSWFNYNNETTGNIWLKTNVSTSTTLTRKLINWNQSLMQWNDTNSTAGITVNYNITGLTADKYYNVYNNSVLAYNLQTDSSGNLPSFTIFLDGEREIKLQEDLEAPQWANNSTNSTVSGKPTEFRLKWTDNVLSSYVFSLDNCTGSLQNITEGLITGVTSWTNVSYVINDTAGCTIRWKVYANDSNNNWNVSDMFTFYTLPTYCDYSIQQWQLPYTINQNNSYYCLASNEYIGGQTAISFASDIQNSTLDCLNYNLDGNDAGFRYGVSLTNNQNTTIKNCIITDFDYGISISSGSNNTITNSTASSNTIGIYMSSSSNNTISNNNVSSNSNNGITFVSSYNNIIANNAANSHGFYGLVLQSSSSNTIINNTANSDSYGLSLSTSNNNNITNNNFSSNSYGVYISSSSNNILTNNIADFSTGEGIHIDSGYNNSITSGSYTGNTADYYLQAAGTSNNFTKTNFIGAREILFFDSSSWFNYNNETNGNIWLKTRVSSTATITRKLSSWYKSIMRWNDSSSGITATYNISDLLANKQYKIYNDTQLVNTITTDSSGSLNFTIYLINEHQITVQYDGCEIGINSLPYTISQSNKYYCVESDLYIAGQNAITFASGVQNSTLDCLNYNLGSNDTSNTNGIYLTGSDTKNNTIKNCNITDFSHGIYSFIGPNNNIINNNTATSNSYGIEIRTGSNNSFTNNRFNGNTYGIYLYASSNNLVNNNEVNSNSYGIYFEGSCSNNNITGGSIASNANSDYYLWGAYTTNNFTNTNFTAERKIYFFDTTSWFNYNNEMTGSIWLKSRVSSSSKTFTRKLINWNQTLMQWNETSSSAVLGVYNITGLNSNKNYVVYVNSVKDSVLTTDSSGNLPSFSIALDTNEREIKVQQDLEAPQWSNNVTFPTSLTTYSSGQTCMFNLTVTDDGSISKVILEFNYTNYTDVSNEGNVYYKTLTDLPADQTGYPFKWYMNDSANNWNVTDQWIYTIDKGPTEIALYLNDTRGNVSYQPNQVANFTVVLNVSNKYVNLTYNISSLVDLTELTPLSNITVLPTTGTYNITGYWLGDANYSSDSETWYAIVSTTSTTTTSSTTTTISGRGGGGAITTSIASTTTTVATTTATTIATTVSPTAATTTATTVGSTTETSMPVIPPTTPKIPTWSIGVIAIVIVAIVLLFWRFMPKGQTIEVLDIKPIN